MWFRKSYAELAIVTNTKQIAVNTSTKIRSGDAQSFEILIDWIYKCSIYT